MRVNARLDEATQQQLEYLTQTTGHSVSDVVRESVAQYYVQVRRQRGASRFLALAGKGDSGRSDVASSVKTQISEILGHKHRLAPLPTATKPARKSVGRKLPAAR
jgi:predicted Ser/Thr protein kinase